MRGNLSNGIVSIKIEEGSKRPIALHEKSKFGKIEANFLQLSLIEACYLLEKGRLNIYEDDVRTLWKIRCIQRFKRQRIRNKNRFQIRFRIQTVQPWRRSRRRAF